MLVVASVSVKEFGYDERDDDMYKSAARLHPSEATLILDGIESALV